MTATSPTKRGRSIKFLAVRRAKGQRKKALEAALGVETVANAQRAHKEGPVRWCKACSRYHRSGKACDLYLRQIVTKKGQVMRVWAH